MPTNITSSQIKEIQELLNLHGMFVEITGQIDRMTQLAVKKFQEMKNLNSTGEVDELTYVQLIQPFVRATNPIFPITITSEHESDIQYTQAIPDGFSLNEMIVRVAYQHLKEHPVEVGGDNRGPWVRLYCQGHDGAPWAWCCGFASYCIRQARIELGITLNELPYTLSCDIMAQNAKKAAIFTNSIGIQDVVKPGDLFLNRKSANDWVHTGIIVAVHSTYVETIEGNTNDEGTREGYEVCKRERKYSSSMDIVLISKLNKMYHTGMQGYKIK